MSERGDSGLHSAAGVSRSMVPARAGSAIVAALLFGMSTPLTKLLLGNVSPLLLAALLYLGSGIGLGCIFVLGRGRRKERMEAPLSRQDSLPLGAAIFFGGVLGAALLMVGLSTTPASEASLLLNLESVFTVLLAWFVFRENFDTRIAVGMLFILAGGVILSFEGEPTGGLSTGSLVVGFFGYGVSLVLFLQALRRVGTARTSAYFSPAPFIGAVISIPLLGEHFGLSFVGAGVFAGTRLPDASR